MSTFLNGSNDNMHAGNVIKELNSLNLIEILISNVLFTRMGGRYAGNKSKHVCTDPSA